MIEEKAIAFGVHAESITKNIDGVHHEPMENLVIDVPRNTSGSDPADRIRKGRMQKMSNNTTAESVSNSGFPPEGLLAFVPSFSPIPEDRPLQLFLTVMTVARFSYKTLYRNLVATG